MQDERVRILHCVGLARNACVINRVAQLAFSEFVRKQDRLRPLMALSTTAAGRRAVWRQIRDRIGTLPDDLGATGLMAYVLKVRLRWFRCGAE